MAHSRAFSDALAEFTRTNAKARDRLQAAFRRYPTARGTQLLEDHALSRNGQDTAPSMASFRVRSVVTESLMRALLDLYDQKSKSGINRFFFLTFSPEDGFTLEDKPVINSKTLYLKTIRLLEKIELQGVFVPEIDVIAKKTNQETARRIVFHVHGLVWIEDSQFRPVKACKELSSLPHFQNPFGIPAISLKSRAMARSQPGLAAANPKELLRHPDSDQTARSIAKLSTYMTKSPLYAKNLWTDADGRQHSQYDGAAFRLKTALRLNETWSRFTPEQMVSAVGEEANLVRLAYRSNIRQQFGSVGLADRRYRDQRLASAAWKNYFEQYQSLGFGPTKALHR